MLRFFAFFYLSQWIIVCVKCLKQSDFLSDILTLNDLHEVWTKIVYFLIDLNDVSLITTK